MEADFSEWLLEQLERKGWSQADLARRAHLGNATLSRVISGLRRVGPDVALAIARGLGEDPVLIFRLAGLLPPVPPNRELEDSLLHYFRQLDERGKKEIILITRAMALADTDTVGD